MSLTKEEALIAVASGKTLQVLNNRGEVADCAISGRDQLDDVVYWIERHLLIGNSLRIKPGPPRDFWVSVYTDGSQSRLWQSAEACIQAQDIAKKLHERLHLREVLE